jgi:hypothetical protein
MGLVSQWCPKFEMGPGQDPVSENSFLDLDTKFQTKTKQKPNSTNQKKKSGLMVVTYCTMALSAEIKIKSNKVEKKLQKLGLVLV